MTVKLSIGWIQSNSKLVSWPNTGCIKLYTKTSMSPLQTSQLSRFSRESPSFSSNLPVSRLEHQISWELPTLALFNFFFFINFVIFETSGTFGRSSGDFRRVFRHCRKLYSYNAKISSRLQVFVLWGLAGMPLWFCRSKNISCLIKLLVFSTQSLLMSSSS